MFLLHCIQLIFLGNVNIQVTAMCSLKIDTILRNIRIKKKKNPLINEDFPLPVTTAEFFTYKKSSRFLYFKKSINNNPKFYQNFVM